MEDDQIEAPASFDAMLVICGAQDKHLRQQVAGWLKEQAETLLTTEEKYADPFTAYLNPVHPGSDADEEEEEEDTTEGSPPA